MVPIDTLVHNVVVYNVVVYNDVAVYRMHEVHDNEQRYNEHSENFGGV